MEFNKDTTALLLVDIQDGLDDLEYYGGCRNNPEAEENCARLLAHFRKENLNRIFIKHCSTNLDSPLHPDKKGNKIKKIVEPLPNELIYNKDVNSAFIGTNLEDQLKKLNIQHLVIVGLTTNHCISSTARMSSNLGFQTTLVSDATAAFDSKGINGENYDAALIHMTSLASLKDEFAAIVNTDELLISLENLH